MPCGKSRCGFRENPAITSSDLGYPTYAMRFDDEWVGSMSQLGVWRDRVSKGFHIFYVLDLLPCMSLRLPLTLFMSYLLRVTRNHRN